MRPTSSRTSASARRGEAGEQVEDLTLEPLHVFEGDVEEVAAAAGGVEDDGLAELFVEGSDLAGGVVQLALAGERDGGGLYRGPLFAEGLDDRGHDQPLDIGARRVVGAQLVALDGVQGTLQERAEDRRLDVRPIGFARFDQEVKLGLSDG